METGLIKAEKKVTAAKAKLERAEAKAKKREIKERALAAKRTAAAATAANAAASPATGLPASRPTPAVLGASAEAAAHAESSTSESESEPEEEERPATGGPALVHRCTLQGKGTKVDLAMAGVQSAEHERQLVQTQVEEKLLETQREVHDQLRRAHYALWCGPLERGWTDNMSSTC
jgi:hypothetical protein